MEHILENPSIQEPVGDLKRCSLCKQDKPLDGFHLNKGIKSGRHRYCKVCRAEDAGRRHTTIKEQQRKWYEKNRLKVLKKVQIRHKNNPEAIRQYKHQHYLRNASRIKAYVVLWQKCHPHVVAWRGILRNTLLKFGRKKEKSTIKLLGYSAEDFRRHIETHWLPHMTWENYGEWHIDHQRPLSSFDPSTDPAVANALSNLKPMWATTRIVGGVLYEGNLNKNGRWNKNIGGF